MAKNQLKLTHKEAIYKFSHDSDESVILADIVCTGQEIDEGSDQVVNIVSANWVGAPNSTIVVTRGTGEDAEVIWSIPADQPQNMDFAGEGYVDTTGNNKDLYVSITGEAAIYMTLRKESGYLTQVETEKYGVYDDETRIGASTTKRGSPDYD